ncbi:hypothetical protein BH24ACT3_BH24ACT3_01570 [soil metagenome]
MTPGPTGPRQTRQGGGGGRAAARRRPRKASTVIWTNGAGNQQCAPHVGERPTHENDIVRIVKEAAAAGRRVKVVGAGHSFTGIACTDGHQVDLSLYGRMLGVDPVRQQVTVQAGIALHRLNDALAVRGLAM